MAPGQSRHGKALGLRLTHVRGVPADEIDAIWPEIEPLVKKALQYADHRHAIQDVLTDLRTERKQLVVSDDPRCILITEILNYRSSGERRLSVFALSGTLPKDWRSILHGLEQWAAAEKGCTSIELSGRKGWTRRLPDWRVTAVCMRKELRHE